MFDTFSRYPRYQQYRRKRSVFNEAYVKENDRWNSDDFAQECVRIHNHYRAQHGCPPLHLSYSICAVSQEWADRISTEDHFHHSNHPQYGENLFVIFVSNNSLPLVTAQQVVESWYAEHIFYPFCGHITRDIISKAGHFTQLIWSNSREMGIGRAISKNNRLYVVANYYPAGNILRKFTENVPPKIHNYFHPPHYYSRRISSRITDEDESAKNLHVPQYHRASSRQLDADIEIETNNLRVPHHYSRKVSNLQIDKHTEISTGDLRVPHHYTRKVSTRQLDTDTEISISNLHVPHHYTRKFSNQQLDTDTESSLGNLRVPHHYSRKISSRQIDTDTSTETLRAPHQYTRKVSSRQLDTSIESLHVPQYCKRNSNQQFDTSNSSVEILHVPHNYTHRNSSKWLHDKGSMENSNSRYRNNSPTSSMHQNFDNSGKRLHVPQYYERKSGRRPSFGT